MSGSGKLGATGSSIAKPEPKRVEIKVRYRAPGPGAYEIPSGVGKQVISTQPSSATLSFGTGPRNTGGKTDDSPGPGAYYKMEPLGSSAISTIRKAPKFTMRGREKFGSTVTSEATAVPGPGAYTNIFNCRLARPPAYTVAARPVETSDRGAKATPAPGRYKCAESIGKQALSTRPTVPAVKFGKDSRKPIITPQGNVGPGEYSCTESLGKQITSSKRSAPAVSFGRRYPAKKLGEARNGPGSYKPLESMGKQYASTFRSSPAASLGGRTQFGSPYNF